MSIGSGSATPAHERLVIIDVIRGLALLGVLLSNLEYSFRVTFYEQVAGEYGDRGEIDHFVRFLISFLVEGRAISVFSLLFGVGLAMQVERMSRAAAPRILVRRLLVLLAFGLFHLLLIWNGDILAEYALVGVVVLPLLFAPARVAALGALGFIVVSLIVAEMTPGYGAPDDESLKEHIAAARALYGSGLYTDVLRQNFSELQWVIEWHLSICSRTAGLMLLGVAAWKSGLVRHWSEKAWWWRRVSALCLPGGLLLMFVANGGDGAWTAAMIVLAIGYAGLALGFGEAVLRRLSWVAPVGRMAFTNYLAQSLILGLVFYGHGLGLLGQVGAAAGLAIGLAIWLAQTAFSTWWLKTHRFGPMEWLWRSATYGRRQSWWR